MIIVAFVIEAFKKSDAIYAPNKEHKECKDSNIN